MRTVGALVAGMFAGLLAGLLLSGPAAHLLSAGDGVPPAGGAVVLGAGPPVLAVLGAAAGVLIDRRSRRGGR